MKIFSFHFHFTDNFGEANDFAENKRRAPPVDYKACKPYFVRTNEPVDYMDISDEENLPPNDQQANILPSQTVQLDGAQTMTPNVQVSTHFLQLRLSEIIL